ncbi:MAG: hypothetical protein M1822_000296 [Bathelium mastoideum]|nr:MAG: hypothetical protein M1822_000296 [Bathelium mastoideum]
MTSTLISRLTTAEEMANFRFYHYEPSMPAAIIFAILFALTTILHTYQIVRSRTWFMFPFVIGGIFETVGYIGRTLSASENPGPYDKIPYIIQSLLLLLAPLFFAASVYMELGRIVMMIDGDKKFFIRRRWLTKTFVIGDVATFLIQATGSSMMASKDADKVDMANYLVIGSLFLQITFFGLFVVTAAIFHIRMALAPTPLACQRPWTKHMIGLYIVSALILVRSVVRTVEFIQGYNGYVMTHEIFLYGFDAVVMFIAVVTMNVIHPGDVAFHIRNSVAGGEKADYQEVDMEDTVV